MSVLGKRDEAGPTRPPPNETHTLLGKEARFSGKLTFEGAVRIDGVFEGEVFTSDHLIIGKGAEVRAQLSVGSVEIYGHVEGDIQAKNVVELKEPARLRGNIETPSLVIAPGVIFDGSCKMSRDEPKRQASVPPAPPPPPPKIK